MNKVVEILMKRDEMTEQEAVDLVNETRDMLQESPDEADEIMADQLGLEPDYIMDVLF